MATPIFLTVEATIQAPISQVWAQFTDPAHVQQWNQASPDWHCPAAESDFIEGGKFSYTMAAKDGSFSFDFWGHFTDIKVPTYLAYTLGDNRTVTVAFADNGSSTTITQTFEAETQNPIELQQGGWQAILNSFKAHVESH